MIYLIISLFVVLVLGVIILLPLLKMKNMLNKNIRDSATIKLLEFNKTKITVSSASIALTVSFINNSGAAKQYLIYSWIAFFICIVIGVLIQIVDYIGSMYQEITISSFSSLLKERNRNDKDQSKIISLYNKTSKTFRLHSIYEIFLFISIYCQYSGFFIAMILIVQAGINI